MEKIIEDLAKGQALIVAFALVGAVMWVSYFISKRLTFGRIHGSAIAIVLFALWCGWQGRRPTIRLAAA